MIRPIHTTLAAAAILLGPAQAMAWQEEDPASPENLRAAAFQIDRHIAAFYRDKNLAVPPVVDDAKFLRRTYLTVIGRVPTLEEAAAFLESEDPHKREALVGLLLTSPGYSSHISNWVFDLIRLQDRNRSTSLEPYRHWVRTAMDENMPWDEFTRRLLASSGNGWDPENSAIGYYARDRGMPHDNLANSMRIFLGKRMECAQCHDDPFGDTDRKDFYQLAAFTHGQYEVNVGHIQPLLRELRDASDRPSEEYRLARMIRDTVHRMSLAGGGSGKIALPSDYQYRDGRPGEIVGGRTPFGRTIRMSPRRDHDDGREKLAEWITTRTDNQFPAVIANRMWRRVMGLGITEPIDDYQPIENSHHPALFKYLADLMVKLEYDLKAFQHVLLLTRTYQFETNPYPSTVNSGDDFHGRKIHRLSAEQIWDSLVTLAAGNPDLNQRPPLDDTIYLQGRPILVGQKTMTQLAEEVLAISSEREMRRYFDALMEQIRNDDYTESAADSSMAMQMQNAGRRARRGLIRASELPSPAPRGHFLHLFGQSDREVVDASSRDPNVGQVLTLMNGFVQERLVNNPDAHLYRSLKSAETPAERIRLLCLAILNRPPTDEEMEWMMEEVEAHGENGVRNLAAALVMSSEFLFLQ